MVTDSPVAELLTHSNNPLSTRMASILTNLVWKFGERLSSQLVSFVVSIIIARILDPSDYGLVAMTMVFISLSNVLVDGGFSSALIQKKNADRLDFSTVFWFSVVFAMSIYAILYISAPYIASFYGEQYYQLTDILRVLGLQVIIYSINSVQAAYISRKMMFRNFFWATLVGTIVSAAIGTYMAYNGYGVWSIVGQQLTASVTNTLTQYYITRKLPGMEFSFTRLKSMFSYGVKLLSANVLTTFFLDMRTFIIGKMYSAAQLSYFDRGKQYPNLVAANINTSIGAVLFPKMSQQQDDPATIKATTRKSIRFSAYIMCPVMLGLAAAGEPLVRLLLTEKWLPCVPFLQLFCIIYLFQPIHTANMQAIKALGRSDIYLKLELIKKTIEIVMLLIVMWISVEAIAINMAVLTTLFTLVNSHPNIKLLNYSLKEQFQDILPAIGMSLVVFTSAYSITYLPISDPLMLLLQFIAGAAVYILLSKITKRPEYIYICSLIRRKTGRRQR